MESYSSTHYYRNLSNDAADQSSNGSDGGGFSMTVVSIQILFIVSIVVGCFLLCCVRKVLYGSSDFDVLTTTPSSSSSNGNQSKTKSKYIEDPDVRKKRLVLYFHRYQCRMVRHVC